MWKTASLILTPPGCHFGAFWGQVLVVFVKQTDQELVSSGRAFGPSRLGPGLGPQTQPTPAPTMPQHDTRDGCQSIGFSPQFGFESSREVSYIKRVPTVRVLIQKPLRSGQGP